MAGVGAFRRRTTFTSTTVMPQGDRLSALQYVVAAKVEIPIVVFANIFRRIELADARISRAATPWIRQADVTQRWSRGGPKTPVVAFECGVQSIVRDPRTFDTTQSASVRATRQ